MRALAALWVVLAHAQMCNPGRMFFLFRLNHAAVTIFIVISGYCLMLPAAESGALPGGVLAFYKSRCRRILPPYYAALFLSVLLSLRLEPCSTYAFRHNLLSHVLLLQDCVGNAYAFDAPMWSIALEWHVYFVMPLLVWAWRRWGMARTVTASLALAYAWPALLQTGYDFLAFFGILPDWYVPVPLFQHYFGLFTLGMAAAYVSLSPSAHHWRAWKHWGTLTGGAFLAVLVFVLKVGLAGFESQPAPLDLFIALAVSCLLVFLSEPRGVLRRALSWKPLVFLGGFSYSLYLCHYPLLLAVYHLQPHLRAHGISSGYGLTLYLFVPLIVGTSFLFFLCFEKPTRRRPSSPDAEGRLYETRQPRLRPPVSP